VAGRRSRQVVQAELNLVRKLIAERKHESEMAEQLGLKERQIRRLKATIYEQDREQWANAAKESLESRALKIIEALHECYDFNRNLMLDQTEQARDRIEASQIMIQAQINIFQLLKQGPTIRLQLPYKVTEIEDERIQYPRHTA
jgi:hypothetical protein